MDASPEIRSNVRIDTNALKNALGRSRWGAICEWPSRTKSFTTQSSSLPLPCRQREHVPRLAKLDKCDGLPFKQCNGSRTITRA
jgi:hypothetical protein